MMIIERPLSMFSRSIILLISICFAGQNAQARVYELTPDGEMTIQQAADAAVAGDIIRLAPGVYHEHVVFSQNSGAYAQPITLEGPRDAIIDGAQPMNVQWEDASFIADGVYRTKLDWRPWHITADEQSLTQLFYRRVKIGASNNPNKAWPAIMKNGPDGRSLKGPEAVTLVNDDEQMFYVRFVDNSNPAEKQFTFARKQPVVTVDGAHRVVIRGVTIRHSWCGVYLRNTLGSVVEDCYIGPSHHGIWVAENADRCTVRFNEVTFQPLAHIDPMGDGRGNWTNWLATKTYGYWDHFGIRFHESTGGNLVHDNHVHDHWGGIEEHSVNANANDGNQIHHNLVENIADDGLEPEGTQPNCHWHDNIVTNAICGYRIKPLLRGPLYIYRNIIYNCGEGIRNFSTSPSKPEVYVYHNTTQSRRTAYSSNSVGDDGLKNYYYFNNLMFGATVWGNAKGSLDPDWHGDHNVFVRRGNTEAEWQQSKAILLAQGLDEHSIFIEDDQPVVQDIAGFNFQPAEDSPVMGAAANLTEALGRTLPGLEDPRYQSGSIEAGALAVGQPMPVLPRQRGAVPDLTEAGYYPDADAQWRQIIDPKAGSLSVGMPLRDDETEKYWQGDPKAKPITKSDLDSPQAVLVPRNAKLGADLLKNGDFAETSEKGFAHWQLTNAKGTTHTVSVDTDMVPEGVAQSARLDIHGTADGLGQMLQRLYVQPGKRYRLTGYIRDNGHSFGRVQIKIFNGKSEKARLDSDQSTSRWKPITVDITDRSIDKIEVIGRFKQTTQTDGKSMWFADFSLREILEDGTTAQVDQAGPANTLGAGSKPVAAPTPQGPPPKTSDKSDTPQEGNLLDNPLFADVNGADHSPEKWKLVNSGSTQHTAAVVSNDSPDGVEQSVRIHINGTGKGQGQMLQRLYVQPGKQYSFSCSIKGDLPDIAFVQIKTFNGKKELERINTANNKVDWQKVAADIDGSEVDKMEIICRFKQSDYVQGHDIYFADMYLGEKSK